MTDDARDLFEHEVDEFQKKAKVSHTIPNRGHSPAAAAICVLSLRDPNSSIVGC